jgi:hypothetical protein
VCDPSQVDLGLPQQVDAKLKAETEAIMAKARAYVERIANDEFLRRALPACKNLHESCAFWAITGEVRLFFVHACSL